MSRVLVLLCCCLAAGCSKSPPAAPVVGTPSGTETINGTERIGWDQPAADASELPTISYVLYIDGTRTPLASPTCATTSTTSGFACSSRLPAMTPGAHALQLASFINDGGVLESGRSAPMQVIVVTESAGAAPPAGADGGANLAARIRTSDGVALRAEQVVDGLRQPSDLAFVPDGRLFVAERDGRIRVIDHDRLLPEPALSLAKTVGAATLLAIAPDPDFGRTHFLFAIYVSTSRSGEPTFSIARFREASNTLADQIVVLDGVRASGSPAAALRFGADGKLYVAFDDGDTPRLRGDPTSLNGKILRLNADGTTPADQPRMSPVYADGARAPRGFDWDAKSGRPSAALPSSTALYVGSLVPNFAGRLLMATTEGRLVSRTPGGQSETFAADRIGGVNVVAVSRDGAIYFATANAIGRLVPDAGGP